jgi:ribosomal protein S18 acetylase RimI-like enzyme
VSRAATADDVDAVAACLASAFFDDPLWGHWTFPDESRRAAGLDVFMRFWASTAVRDPWVRMTDAAEAVAVWHPPGEPELTPAQEELVGPLLDRLFGERAGELLALFDRFDEHHTQTEPHFYLSWWATHRDHAGRGVGTELMRENLAEIDALGMPAYLESTNPANLARYEALGFERRAEFAPPEGPVITTMWRKA